MRPIHPALASAAALLSLATAASAQDARMLSWPGKVRPAAAGVPVAAAVPPPFVADTAGPGRVNNRYSPRGAARAFVPPPAVYTPAPSSRPAPPPMADYGPPVIPNVVKPAHPSAPVVAAAPPPAPKPVPAAAPTPAPVIVAAPAAKPSAPVPSPVKVAADAGKVAAVAPVPVAAVPDQAAAGGPFIRPPSANGPRFYSVHREFGGRPDATWRSKPAGAATERLPTGFFAAGSAEQVEEDEPQDDAETRAAALRAAEKATKAKGKRR